MKLVALLAVIALVPVAAAAGYLAHTDPAPPSMLEAIGGHLKRDAKPEPTWFYIVTKGPFRGQTADALQALAASPADLKQAPGVYVVQTCTSYSTTGRPKALLDRQIVQYCTKRRVTRAQVVKYAETLNEPVEKS